MDLLPIVVANTVIVALVVAIHYEGLFRLSLLMPWVPIRHRARIVVPVFGALIAHAVEVWLFALAYYLMHRRPGWGELEGAFDGGLLACAYFSFTTFTTLGFGDIAPSGAIRYLTGIEALTGLVLITWTASFLFLEMTRYWPSRSR